MVRRSGGPNEDFVMSKHNIIAILLTTVLVGSGSSMSAMAAGNGIDVAKFVKAANAKCLSLYPRIVTVRDGIYQNGIRIRPPANATIDFRGVTVRGQANGSDAKSVTTIMDFNHVCVLGGRHWGKQNPQIVPWVVGHRTYGAGIIFSGGAGAITVENALIENSLQDGITLKGGLPQNVTFGMRGTYIRNNSDDGIQNDGGKKILFIEDSLIESKMGISLRPGRDSTAGGGSHGNYRIPISNTLISVICVADDRPDGSDRRDPRAARRNNCGSNRSASMPFKWSGAASGVGVEMTDSIVRFEARSRNGWRSMRWLPGTYRNVVLVWDPVTSGMTYEGPSLPAGVRLTTDASVWTRAKAEWLRVHGCTANGGCTFPNSR